MNATLAILKTADSTRVIAALLVSSVRSESTSKKSDPPTTGRGEK